MSLAGPNQYKLVLLGETAVGKSSIALRFVRNQFLEYQESTIGAAFLTQSVEIDGKTVKFEIWDTAGQERYHSLAPMYYRGAKAAVVVYDITAEDSFTKAQNWVTELQQSGSQGMIIALAGNKADLAETQREVSASDAKAYANKHNLFFMEVSAKQAINVNGLFCSIARELARNDEGNGDENDDNGRLRLNARDNADMLQDGKAKACGC